MAKLLISLEWQGNHSFLFDPERPVKSEVKPSRRVDKAKCQKMLYKIASNLGLQGEYGLSVHITSAKTIQKLNNKYRKENHATDVLSFPLTPSHKKEDFPKLLGDIFICESKIVSQAKEFGVSAEMEFERTLVHGFLHLLDFDHEKNPAIWRKIIKALYQKKIIGYNHSSYEKRKTS